MHKIAVIEDEPMLQNAYKQKLEASDFQVIFIDDGQKAISILHENVPSIIILDLVLPGLNGLEVLKLIKNDELLKNIPVIVASNLDDSRTMIEATKFGASDYFLKSQVSIQDIVSICQKHIIKQ